MHIDYTVTASDLIDASSEWNARNRKNQPALIGLAVALSLLGFYCTSQFGRTHELANVGKAYLCFLLPMVVGAVKLIPRLPGVKRYTGVMGEGSATILPGHVEVVTPRAMRRVRWSQVDHVADLPSALAVKISKAVVFIPKRAFADGTAVAAFSAELQDRWMAARPMDIAAAQPDPNVWPPPPAPASADSSDDPLVQFGPPLNAADSVTLDIDLTPTDIRAFARYTCLFFPPIALTNAITALYFGALIGSILGGVFAFIAVATFMFASTCFRFMKSSVESSEKQRLALGSQGFATDFVRFTLATDVSFLDADIGSMIRTARNHSGDIYIYPTVSNAYIVPVRAFTSPAASRAFADRLTASWREARRRRRASVATAQF